MSGLPEKDEENPYKPGRFSETGTPKTPRFLAQIMKFGLVGVLNTIVDIGVFALLNALAGLYYVISHVISYGAGMVNSFILNRGWTFKVGGKVKVRELVSFVVLNLAAWGLSLCLIALFVDQLGVAPIPAKVLATVVSSALTFLGSRFFVFTGEKR